MIDLNYNIPKNIKRARIDVGLSSTGPNAAFWLNKYDNILVIGIEPNPNNYQKILNGTEVNGDIQIVANENVVKQNNKILSNLNDKANYFIPIECAIDNVVEKTKKTFYCTSNLNTGCSSLNKPINGSPGLNGVTIDSEVIVDVISLETFLDKFPFEQIPVIEFLKTDTQSNDLNVVKSCGKYLERVCFVFSEYYAHSSYEGEKSQQECLVEFDTFMKKNGFKQFCCSGTDIGYVNENLISHIFENNILNDCIEFQNGYNWL